MYILHIPVPDDHQKANITPVFKGKKKDPGNYRAVSLISGSGNIAEQIFPAPVFKLINRG